MALVVLAPQTLDEMELMVRSKFEEVNNYKTLQPKHGQPLFGVDSLPYFFLFDLFKSYES